MPWSLRFYENMIASAIFRADKIISESIYDAYIPLQHARCRLMAFAQNSFIFHAAL